MDPIFIPLPAAAVAHYRTGGHDAYGLRPEPRISDGGAIPCRATLRMVPEGAPYLIVAHRPFQGLNPYAETGPIFLSADPLPPAEPGPELPKFLRSPQYILRGYSADERIVYGTGAVVDTPRLIDAARALLNRADLAFLHIRSATNNCFHVRVERG